MLSLEVFEPTAQRPYKEIYYRDSRGQLVQHVLLDTVGRLLEKSVSEFNAYGKLATHVIFGHDYVTPLAYRDYVFDDEGNEIGFSDFQYTQNIAQLRTDETDKQQKQSHQQIQHEATHILTADYQLVHDQKMYWNYKDADNNSIGYEVFTITDTGLISDGVYDTKNQSILKESIPCYMVF